MAKVVEQQSGIYPSSRVLARVGQEELEVFPTGLEVPHDAMYVLLDSFEGPLDLLLHLVRKNNLNILDFRISEITAQYLAYVELMSTLRLKRAGAYLLMAATLVEIKSRALLPQMPDDEEDLVDQELELRRRLLAYERLKNSAEQIDELPRMDRDNFATHVDLPIVQTEDMNPQITIDDLVEALSDILSRARLYRRHEISRVKISIPQRTKEIEQTLRQSGKEVPFKDLFKVEEGVTSVIASLVGILELIKRGVVSVRQEQSFAPIYVAIKV